MDASFRSHENGQVREGKKGSTYPALKKLGARHFETTQSGFQLPEHAELNLTSAQSAELIAEHFSRISQEFEPLNTSLLPPNDFPTQCKVTEVDAYIDNKTLVCFILE